MTAQTSKVYGSGQAWAKTARNGIVVSTHVSRPIRHGVRLNAKVHMNARWKARQLARPRLNAVLLHLVPAALLTKPSATKTLQ